MTKSEKRGKDKFRQVISLGYFCSVASELERLGYREASYPFDWCISSFKGVIEAIQNHFNDYFAYEMLSQHDQIREHYRNDAYDIQFFHDFNRYQSLEKQLENVKKKYEKRIERFYRDIQTPTLFIRYISNEKRTFDGHSEELVWVEAHIDEIRALLKSFHPDNEIIFVANEELSSEILEIYSVQKDENDLVARKPFEKNRELFQVLEMVAVSNKEQNIAFYEKKQRKKKNKILFFGRRVKEHLKHMYLKEYHHSKTYH